MEALRKQVTLLILNFQSCLDNVSILKCPILQTNRVYHSWGNSRHLHVWLKVCLYEILGRSCVCKSTPHE